MTFVEYMEDVERRLERELGAGETDMLVKMRDAGKSSEAVAEVLAQELSLPPARVLRYEANGSSVIDITDMPVPDEDEHALPKRVS